MEQTGIGVTVIGACSVEELKIGTSHPDDVVAAVGLPSVADQVLPAEKEGKIAEPKTSYNSAAKATFMKLFLWVQRAFSTKCKL